MENDNEYMIDACMEILDEDTERFTEYEQEFLCSIDDRKDSHFLSEKQKEVLLRIYNERVA